MIYITGIIITFFLSLILLTKNQKSSADRILSGWLCVILVHLTLFYLFSSQAYVRFPYLLGLEIPLPLLHGPFLYLYTKALTSGKMSFREMSFHFIPYILVFLTTIPFLLLGPEDKIKVYQNEGEGYEILSAINLWGMIASGAVYTVLSLRTLMRHKRQIRNNFSYTEKINLEWLFRLILGLSLIWILVFLADDEIIFTSVVLFVVFIGYYGIKQVGVFTNQPPPEPLPVHESSEVIGSPVAPPENTKYENSTLTDDQARDIHLRLVGLMKEEKLYLTPELTLAMVSERLGVHPNTLSQVINTWKQKNFFDYINSLRIEEFKERVHQPDNQKYTLLSLAFECGFNSKTSFNRNFKNLTGKSPSTYVKEYKSKPE